MLIEMLLLTHKICRCILLLGLLNDAIVLTGTLNGASLCGAWKASCGGNSAVRILGLPFRMLVVGCGMDTREDWVQYGNLVGLEGEEGPGCMGFDVIHYL